MLRGFSGAGKTPNATGINQIKRDRVRGQSVAFLAADSSKSSANPLWKKGPESKMDGAFAGESLRFSELQQQVRTNRGDRRCQRPLTTRNLSPIRIYRRYRSDPGKPDVMLR